MEKIRQAFVIMIACICGIVMLAGCDDDTNQNTASAPTESATETTLTETISESTTDSEKETESKSTTEKGTEGKAETSTEKKAETTTAEKTTSKGESSTEEPRHQATTTTESARGQSETQTPVATKEPVQTTTKTTTAATRQTTVTTAPPQTQPPQTQTQPPETQPPTTQPPPPAFDPNTYAWPEPGFDVDKNIADFTVNGVFYLEEFATRASWEGTNTLEADGSIVFDIRRPGFSRYANLNYRPNDSIHVVYVNGDSYSFSFTPGAGGDNIQVYYLGNYLSLPRGEVRMLAVATAGAHGGSVDQLLDNGFTWEGSVF